MCLQYGTSWTLQLHRLRVATPGLTTATLVPPCADPREPLGRVNMTQVSFQRMVGAHTKLVVLGAES